MIRSLISFPALVTAAVRMLSASPGYAVTSMLLIGSGIGLNTAVFAIVDAGILSPPPINDARTLVKLERRWQDSSGSGRGYHLPYPVAEAIPQGGALTSIMLEAEGGEVAFGAASDEGIRVKYVSLNWFEELGVQAQLGRLFSSGIDNAPGAAPVIVLADGFWRSRFGGNAEICGKPVLVNGRPVTVIGVAPGTVPNFGIANNQAWLLLSQVRQFLPLDGTDSAASVTMYARLAPGVSFSTARESVRPMVTELARTHPKLFRKGEWLEPLSAETWFRTPEESAKLKATALLAGSLAALVLLTAAANLGGMILSRVVGRIRDFGVRLALGASRGHLIGMIMTEALILAGGGGILSVLLAMWASQTLTTMLNLPFYVRPELNSKTLAVSFAATIISGVAAAVPPVWRLASAEVRDALVGSGWPRDVRADGMRIKRLLIAVQIATSCLLVGVAGVSGRGLQRMLEPPGFAFDQVAVVEAPLDKYGVGWSTCQKLFRAT